MESILEPEQLRFSEQRRIGELYKIAPDSTSIGYDVPGATPRVNESKMCATARISTPAVDRVKDSVNPRTVKLESYRTNPIVLLDHGFDCALPVGKSETPEGKFTVKVSPDAVSATCYFHGKTLESEQVFALVAGGFLRGTSVRFGSFKATGRRNDAGELIQIIDDWELEEWSWTALGCNRETLTTAVGKKLCGQQLAEPILKSLQPYVIKPKRARSRGWTPPAESPAPELTGQPHGARLLKSLANGLADVQMLADAGMESLEQPDVRARLKAALPLLDQAGQLLAACHSEVYGETIDVAPKSSPAERRKNLETVYVNDFGARLAIHEIDGVLVDLSRASNLSTAQRDSVLGVVKKLGEVASPTTLQRALRVVADRVALGQSRDEAERNSASIKLLGEMRNEMKKLNSVFLDLLPYDPAIHGADYRG